MTRFLFAINFLIYKYLKSRGASDETTAVVAVPLFALLNILSCGVFLGAIGYDGLMSIIGNRYSLILITATLACYNYYLVYKNGKYHEIFRDISINIVDYQNALKSSRFYMLFTFLGVIFSFLALFILRKPGGDWRF